MSLDRPGRLTDATRGNIMKGKKKKKIEKEKKSMRNTGTRIHTHDIHTPAARLKKEIRLKMETLLHTRCLRERVDRD